MYNFDESPEQKYVSYHPESIIEEVNVIILYIPRYDKEFIPNVQAVINAEGDVDLNSVLAHLKKMKFPIDSNMIFYLSQSTGMYVYCGNEPLPQSVMVPSRDCVLEGERRTVTIRARQLEQLSIPRFETDFELETAALVDLHQESSPDAELALSPEENGKRKRHKERKIGEILDLVLKWRKYYTGFRDQTTGQIVKLSLDDAAKKLGVAKKSLDDYLLQIRFARKFNFNFQDYYHERVGVLRSFVKKMKSTMIGEKVDDSVFSSDGDGKDTPVSKVSKSKKIQKQLAF